MSLVWTIVLLLGAAAPPEAPAEGPALRSASGRQELQPPQMELQEGPAPFLDFGWLEMHPRLGMAVFTEDFHIDPSPCFGLEFRAPFPFLSPPSNPHGEYFGLFLELDSAIIERTLVPELEQARGVMVTVMTGLDYALLRNETWRLLIRGGGQYANYGGVTDLREGWGGMAGLTAGLTVSRSVSLTLAPTVMFGRGGDHVLLGFVGLSVEF